MVQCVPGHGGDVMSQENDQISQEDKDVYRRVLAKLALVPTQYLALLTKIMTVLSIRGEVFAVLLEKAVGEAISPKLSSSQQEGQSNVGIEGEYEIPALAGGVVDLGQLPCITADTDYYQWELHDYKSEASDPAHVVVAKADDNMVLSRLIGPSGPLELCLTQAQVEYLVRHMMEKIKKITKAGVFFFFRVTQDEGLTYELYSFKIIGYGRDQLRFAVRKAANPGNGGVPLKGAYIVRPV